MEDFLMAKKATYEELEQRVKELENEVCEHKQTKEALRDSEEQFGAVAGFTYDWEYWVGPDGHHRSTEDGIA